MGGSPHPQLNYGQFNLHQTAASLGMKIRPLKTQAYDLIVKQLEVAQRYNIGAIAVLRLYTYL